MNYETRNTSVSMQKLEEDFAGQNPDFPSPDNDSNPQINFSSSNPSSSRTQRFKTRVKQSNPIVIVFLTGAGIFGFLLFNALIIKLVSNYKSKSNYTETASVSMGKYFVLLLQNITKLFLSIWYFEN